MAGGDVMRDSNGKHIIAVMAGLSAHSDGGEAGFFGSTGGGAG